MAGAIPFVYDSLRTALEAEGLVLQLPVPKGVKGADADRAWCARLIGAMVWFASQADQRFVWRGQRNAAWPLQPRLNRHVASVLNGATIGDVDLAEQEILTTVKLQRWDRLENGDSLRSLELLAVLQHHGVPTRMLDVTLDPLVAAFFASGSGPDEALEPDGAIVAIRVPQKARVELAEIDGADGTLGACCDVLPTDAGYALWSPPSFDARIITQRGQFLVPNLSRAADMPDPYLPRSVSGIGVASHRGGYGGRIESYFRGFLYERGRGRPPANPVNLAMIVIPSARKAPLRAYLRALGLTDLSIYPDRAGYASSFPPS